MHVVYLTNYAYCLGHVVIWFMLFLPISFRVTSLALVWGHHMMAPVPVKQPWRIWVKRPHESTKNLQWCNGMVTFSAFLVLCAGNPLIAGACLALRAVMHLMVSLLLALELSNGQWNNCLKAVAMSRHCDDATHLSLIFVWKLLI